MKEQNIIDRLTIVQVEVTCPSGAVSKTRVDKHGNEVFTDGTVRYMDRKLLRPFTSARQAVIRLCLMHGTRLLGGYAIPSDCLPVVKIGLEAISKELAQERRALERKLPEHMQTWVNEHQEVLQYKGKFPLADEIICGIRMSASIFKINPEDASTIGDGITESIGGLAHQVLREVAQDARDAFSTEATKASSRAKNVLIKMASKLKSLAFVDARLTAVAGMIETTLEVLPSNGPLNGRDFAAYAGLMNTLMRPNSVVETAKLLAERGDNEGVWSTFCQNEQPQSEGLVQATVTTEAKELAPAAPGLDLEALGGQLIEQEVSPPAHQPIITRSVAPAATPASAFAGW